MPVEVFMKVRRWYYKDCLIHFYFPSFNEQADCAIGVLDACVVLYAQDVCTVGLYRNNGTGTPLPATSDETAPGPSVIHSVAFASSVGQGVLVVGVSVGVGVVVSGVFLITI